MIALVTNRADMTADWLVQELGRRDCEFVRINSEDFPAQCSVVWHDRGGRLTSDEIDFDASELAAVWWRRSIAPVLEPAGRTPGEHDWALSEAHAAWQGFWRTVDAHWVNHPDANLAADHKMVQLRAAAAVGLAVPATLITNDPAAAHAFGDAHPDVICKAGRSGLIHDDDPDKPSRLLYTQLLTDSARDRLDDVGPEPYLLQQAIDKRYDVRVTVIGDQAFGCRIDSQQAPGAQTDWRAGNLAELPHDPIELPPWIGERCVTLTQRFGLRFAAVDLAVTPDGGWTFFEINPNGQWAWIEQLTGQPLAAALADELTTVPTT